MRLLNLHYTGYGLRFATNRPIPGLLALDAEDEADVRVWFDAAPAWLDRDALDTAPIRYTSWFLDDDGRPTLTVKSLADGAYYCFLYTDGAEYIMDCAGTCLWVSCPPSLAWRDILSYLLGPIMGLLLRLRGYVCLHASAIAVDGRAVVFAGDNMAGKSTTAMALARRGYPVLSDDIVPLWERAGHILAQSGYPRMRLRPLSLAPLSEIGADLPPLPDVSPEQRLHFDLLERGYRFQVEPMPLGMLYYLDERLAEPCAPCITAMSGPDGLMACVQTSYANRFLDKEMRCNEFDVLGRVVDAVPVRRLHAHRDADRLSQLCDVILGDIAKQFVEN